MRSDKDIAAIAGRDEKRHCTWTNERMIPCRAFIRRR